MTDHDFRAGISKMTPANAAEVALSSADFARLPIDELLVELQHAERVQLHFDEPVPADSMKSAMFLAALSHKGADLSVTFSNSRPPRAIVNALNRSLLGPLIWQGQPRAATTAVASELSGPDLSVADSELGLFCAHTSAFSARTREAFQADIARKLRAASIFFPESVLGAVSTIGFEVNSNAEEYGALREDGTEGVAFRFLAVQVHKTFIGNSAPLASSYLAEYQKSGHSQSRYWLELLAVDAGVGIPYPSYYVLASETGRPTRNVYDVDPAEERQRLKLVLDSESSTKGRFGRRLNTQTAIGEGVKMLKFRLAAVRGFAAVRTGRSVARWWHASQTLTADETRHLPGFEVDAIAKPFFHGTAWQILVPLDTQYNLSL